MRSHQQARAQPTASTASPLHVPTARVVGTAGTRAATSTRPTGTRSDVVPPVVGFGLPRNDASSGVQTRSRIGATRGSGEPTPQVASLRTRRDVLLVLFLAYLR